MVHGITHRFVKRYTEQCLKNILEMQELIDIIICVTLVHTRNRNYHLYIAVAEVVVMHNHKI